MFLNPLAVAWSLAYMRRSALGYLVPEFPGSTHTFFERELRALDSLGINAAVLSTRRPRPQFRCHSWTEALMGRTTYLVPPRPELVVEAIAALLGAGPTRWWRCWKAIASAEDLGAIGKLKALLLLPFAAELIAWSRRRGVPHVHSHFCADGAHVAMFAFLLGGPTYSISLHSELWSNGGNQKNKWRHAKFGIAVTRTLLEAAQGELGDAAPETWGIAPMGVDASVFRRERPYEPFAGRGPLRIFSCGRINPGKAPDDLIRAVAILLERGYDASLRIAGEDDSPRRTFLPQLEALAASLGVSDRVEFLGASSEETVREELEQAHVFALASLNEALGVATMEAMVMGVPAIATKVGGVPELIESGVHGLLVEPRRPDQIADAIARIAGDRPLANALSRSGEARIRQGFTTMQSASTLVRLFLDLSGGGAPMAPVVEVG